MCTADESIKAAGKGRSGHRARSKRGTRARASKDTSKLLLLYDEDILERDPLREQKDLAFAQSYLTRVGECCSLLPPFLLRRPLLLQGRGLQCSLPLGLHSSLPRRYLALLELPQDPCGRTMGTDASEAAGGG